MTYQKNQSTGAAQKAFRRTVQCRKQSKQLVAHFFNTGDEWQLVGGPWTTSNWKRIEKAIYPTTL